jgi:hypothetical protein
MCLACPGIAQGDPCQSSRGVPCGSPLSHHRTCGSASGGFPNRLSQSLPWWQRRPRLVSRKRRDRLGLRGKVQVRLPLRRTSRAVYPVSPGSSCLFCPFALSASSSGRLLAVGDSALRSPVAGKLLWPRLTSPNPSRTLPSPVAAKRQVWRSPRVRRVAFSRLRPNLPMALPCDYRAFPTDEGLPHAVGLVFGFCPSGPSLVIGFLQTPSRDGSPCLDSRFRSPGPQRTFTSESRAMPGARHRPTGTSPVVAGRGLSWVREVSHSVTLRNLSMI